MFKEDGPFELVDCATGLVLGPYHFLSEARAQAERFASWEIVADGQLVCAGPPQTDEAVVPH